MDSTEALKDTVVTGGFRYDVENGIVDGSDSFAELMRLPAGVSVSLDELCGNLHPDDRASFAQSLKASLVPPTCGANQSGFECTVRVVGAPGTAAGSAVKATQRDREQAGGMGVVGASGDSGARDPGATQEPSVVIVRGCAIFRPAGGERPSLLPTRLVDGRTGDQRVGGQQVAEQIIGTVIDLSPSRRMSAALQKSETRYRFATEVFNCMVYEWNATTGECWRSEGLSGLVGVQVGKDEPTAQWWQHRVHPEDLRGVETQFAVAVESKQHLLETRYRVRHTDGHWIWVLDRQRLVWGKNGKLAGGVGCSQDISAEYAAEARAAELSRKHELTLAQLDALVQSAPIGIALFDRELKYELVNDRQAGINGVPRENHLGRKVSEVIPGLGDRVQGYLDEVLKTGVGSEWMELEGESAHAPGEKRVWNASWFPVRSGNGHVTSVGSIVQEITAQRRSELALRNSENRFRALTQAMPHLVWTCQRDGSCSYLSEQWERVTGQSAEEARGNGWLAVIHAEDLDRHVAAWKKAVQEEQIFESDVRMRMADGSYRWHLARALPVRDAQGNVQYWIGTSTDIEDRKLHEAILARDNLDLEALVAERSAELERMHRQQRFNDRLTLMGTLAAGLGHDLGNLLLPARMRLHALSRSQLSEAHAPDVELLRTTLEYAQRLSDGLRLLASDPRNAKAPANTVLHQWWPKAEPIVRAVVPLGTRLIAPEFSDTPEVQIGPTHLLQVLINLVQNAGTAIKGRRDGKIELSVQVLANHVHFRVSDNGSGMTEQVRAQCIEPFFSTKNEMGTSGLGLTIVSSILSQAGGSLKVESELGVGSTFVIHLKSADPPANH